MTDHVGPEGDHRSASPLRDTLSQLRLRELLVEVQDRVEQIVKGRDRLDGLVEAMLVVTSGLETMVNTEPSPTSQRAIAAAHDSPT